MILPPPCHLGGSSGSFNTLGPLVDPIARIGLQPITLPMLSKALNELSSSKAVGQDGLPILALRKCFAVLGPHLLHLVNTSITKCVFPSEWKVAVVVPLHKSGSRDSPENFRPVSILSVLSKLCEKVVCKQLSEHLNSQNLLAPHCVRKRLRGWPVATDFRVFGLLGFSKNNS